MSLPNEDGSTVEDLVKEITSDLEYIKRQNDTTKETVQGYEKALDQIKESHTAALNQIEARVKEVELKHNRQTALGGGGGRAASIARSVVESEQFKRMLELKTPGCPPIQLDGGLNRALRQRAAIHQRASRGLETKSVTNADLAGLIFEYQDMNEVAKVDRYYQPSLRSLINWVPVATNTVRYKRRLSMYHLAAAITTEAANGQADVILANAEGVRPGSTVTLSPGAAQEENLVVDSIDYDSNTVTMTTNLTQTHPVNRLLVSDDFIMTAKTKVIPKSQWNYDNPTISIIKLATVLDVPREDLEDADRFEAELNLDLPPALERQFDKSLFYGNGGDRELDGIFKNASAASYLWSNGIAGDTELDACRRAFLVLRNAKRQAEYLHLHPNHLASVELAKSTTGKYIDKIMIMEDGSMRLWRVMVREEDTLETTDFLVSNWSFGARGYDRQQAEIQMSTENTNNFETDTVTVKATERLGVAIREPQAFVKGKLDSAPA